MVLYVMRKMLLLLLSKINFIKMKNDKLNYVFIPSLFSLIINEQNKKGRPLNLDELEFIRDNAICIALPVNEIQKLIESRRYNDINPENLWVEYIEYLNKNSLL